MSFELKSMVTCLTLAIAKVISLFSHKLSNTPHSYQSKKLLKPSNKQTEALEHFLSLCQKKELISFIPTKSDLYGQPNINKIIYNQKLKNIPSLLGMLNPSVELIISSSS